MASILSLKRRINAAQNVSKTTRAMQMIAASKLKRAQDQTLASRAYVEKITELTNAIASKIAEDKKHPYMEMNQETKKKLVIVFSPDKGLCGGMITNLLREVSHYNSSNYIFLPVGKKIEQYTKRFDRELVASFQFGNTLPSFNMVYPILSIVDELFLSKKVQSVEIISTRFNNIFSQATKATTLLPITLSEEQKKLGSEKTFELFEPNITTILPILMKRYIEMVLYQQLLESFLAEQAARMLAMQNATNNAKDIIADLKLEYNKTRQAKITSEILDISGGGIMQNAY